jgi:hypothetical protein
MKIFYTYLYRDPKNGIPIYIGKGTGRRAKEHARRKCRNGQYSQLTNLINKRRAEGYIVEPIINNEVDEATALFMECFWINFYGRADLGTGTLFNLTDGGDGVSGSNGNSKPRSAEHKAKISAALKGRPSNHTGKKHSPETMAKMAASHQLRRSHKN